MINIHKSDQRCETISNDFQYVLKSFKNNELNNSL